MKPRFNNKRAIAYVQKQLEINYYIDFLHYGVWNAELDRAIITALQYEINLREPGEPFLVDGIYRMSLSVRLPVLKYGDKNKFVFLLQALILKHGYETRLDGRFSKSTRSLIHAFIYDNDLSIDYRKTSFLVWNALLTHPVTIKNAPISNDN